MLFFFSLIRSTLGLASKGIHKSLQKGSSVCDRLSKGQSTAYATPVQLIFRRVSGVPCVSLVVPETWSDPFWKEIILSGMFLQCIALILKIAIVRRKHRTILQVHPASH